jgi:pimeloyl-ACP methyl ester carboxylesterase
MKTAAQSVHDAVRRLGFRRVYVVGHDIGLMVADAYAAMYPHEVGRLALMDAFLPGIAGWEPIYNNPSLWHFRFHGPTPLALVAGRERIYFDYYWNEVRRRSDPFALSDRPQPIRRSVFASGAHGCGLELF